MKSHIHLLQLLLYSGIVGVCTVQPDFGEVFPSFIEKFRKTMLCGLRGVTLVPFVLDKTKTWEISYPDLK